MPWCFSHKEVGEWKDLSHRALWKWAWLLFIWIRWFALQSPSFPSTPRSYLHQHSPGLSAYRWAFQPMEHQSYFKTVTTLTVELSKYRVQIFSSTRVLIMQLQRALSTVDLLFIIPFYLQLSTIFLHSESDSPRCPGDKWGYYCLQAVHDASGVWKKMNIPSKVLIILRWHGGTRSHSFGCLLFVG